MYKTRKKEAFILVNGLVLLLSVFISLFLLERYAANTSPVILAGVPALVFLVFLISGSVINSQVNKKLQKRYLESGETAYLDEFIDRLRFCYSYDDLYKTFAEILEIKADCSILLVDRQKNYVLYNSPNRISSYPEVREKLSLNFELSWKDGFYFLGEKLGLVSDCKKARGFFICYNGIHCFIFNRYTRLFDLNIYSKFYEEFCRFFDRTKIIANLSEISSLTKEWEQLAEVQVSFLPHKMPDIAHLKIAAYYRPLVNVSGDYYTVLPIDSSRTLLMLGDVSGKGLPAALIMGLVMNTVKIIENKNDLVGLIKAVDKAIKNMHLQDKYTVLFLGIVDTDAMKISYINASMSDPIILTRAPDGYRIKSLASNASLVGIIDMDDVSVSEQRLFRGDTILLATDGVSEVMDEDGIELGDTDLFKNTLTESASKTPQQFVDAVVDLIMRYNGDKRLHDDITMMVVKVG